MNIDVGFGLVDFENVVFVTDSHSKYFNRIKDKNKTHAQNVRLDFAGCFSWILHK